MKPEKSRADWLQEALLLEQLHGEWETEHAAAFANVSASFLRRSSCPRLEKAGQRGTTGKPMITFAPADVREWNTARTIRRVA
jgi:hypothetical protein